MSYTCPHMPLAINHIFELLGKWMISDLIRIKNE
jgi:hypothetical protein